MISKFKNIEGRDTMLNFFKRRKTTDIISPMTGKIVDIEEVPDKVFAEKMIGDGLGIDPTEGIVVAPFDGEVVSLFPTNHAIGLKTKNGLELLIHVGLDTVELKGEGFERLVEENEKVKEGDVLLKFDIDFIESKGKSVISPVIVTNMDIVKDMKKHAGEVKKGETVMMEVKV